MYADNFPPELNAALKGNSTEFKNRQLNRYLKRKPAEIGFLKFTFEVIKKFFVMPRNWCFCLFFEIIKLILWLKVNFVPWNR